MKNSLLTTLRPLAVSLFAIGCGHAAELLAVDFGGASNPVETGFVGQSVDNFTHSTTAGDITVAISGYQGLFDYTTNAGTAHLDFFRDFYFKNGGTMTLVLSGPGVSANTDYDLTFWALYGAQARDTTIAGTSGTSGTTLGPIAYEINPTSLSQNADSGTFTSDGTGNLTFAVSGTNSRPALNGFTISTVGGGDTTPPTLASSDIVDDQGGGSVTQGSLVTYTVTFNEDMDDTTVSSADFDNAGTSNIGIGTVTETAPGVFSVPVTPSDAGTLQLRVPIGATLDDAAGNSLITSSAILDDTTLTVTVGGGDMTPPTLASSDIVDDQSGGSVSASTLVTYTVTFNEDMDDTTVSSADFDNAGTSSISIGAVTETAPGVFSVPVTPNDAGTLQLRVPIGATLNDAAGNPLITSSAILDDTTLTVTVGGGDMTPPTLASSDIVDDQSGGPVSTNSLVTYTVTFSEDMDDTTVSASDFDNAGSSTITIGTIAETSPGVFSVEVTPADVGTLQLRVPIGASLDDAAGNPLNTASAILDDTTLTVAASSTTTLLAVDFGSAGTEPGFVEQSSTNFTHTTTAGNLTVDVAGTQGLFDFATTGTNDLLYRDFYFKNGGTITLTLSGIAISPGTDYELTFWSYYGAEGRNTTFDPASGTAGPSLGPIAPSTVPAPTGLADSLYSISGTYTSDGTGAITIAVGGTSGRPAINGFTIATIGPDTTPPSLLPGNIVDNQGGGPINENTLVTYTLTFSEDIDDTTVSSADFGNAGTSPISFGAITEVTPGVFTVDVTPTAAGTLQLQIPIGASIMDPAGLSMDTASATVDDTSISVVVAPPDNTAPTPNPMTFAEVPYASSETSIAMEATAASDLAGVEYNFIEISGNSGGDDSGWQGSANYEDTGLTTGLVYTYTVTARDLSSNQNATAASAQESATAQTPVVPPTITAPTSRHIVQRSASNVGAIEIEGTYSVGVPDSIEARAVVMTGGGNNGTTTAWQTIDASPGGGIFSGTLSNVPAGGWYQLEVRTVISGIPSTAAVLEKVGVGDIYVTAGQSNSANFAANEAPQDDRISARTSTTDSTWTLATAPLPISNGGWGSPWTWLANKLIAAEDIPIGLVSLGQGGSPASSWTAGAGNYTARLKPAVQSFPINGFRAALWHQGETDSIGGVSAVTHSGYLNGMVSQSRIDSGWTIPWYLAEVSYHGGSNISAQESVAAGQRISILDDALVFFGPSTDELHLTGGGSLHFNAVGTNAHAQGWADILLGNVTVTPENGDFEEHGWIEYAAPFDTSPTPLADGASTIIDLVTTGLQLRVLDWRILAASGVNAADGSNGFHNPTTGTYAGAIDSVNGGVLPNMAGKHVALLDGGTADNYFLQSTRADAEADTTYTLTVALGVRDNSASFGTARLELTANGVVVASASFDKAALDAIRGSDASGTFTDASISWASGGTVAANQPLAIRVFKEGGSGTVLDFDNVRLNAAVVPTNDFNSWIDGFGLAPADQGFEDDPDGDGLASGLESWLGTDPGQFNAGLADLSTDGTTSIFIHPQNPSPPSDVSGFYQWSSNLVDWYLSGSGPGGGPTVILVPDTVGTTTTVTASASEALDILFLRVGVSQN